MNKKQTFKIYSENLKFLLLTFQNRYFKGLDGKYICPLGLSVHTIEDLLPGKIYQLTEEHVPLRALGGKGVCLVRKDINSLSGHSVDKRFIEYIQNQKFPKGKASIPGKVKFNMPRFKHGSVDISINQSGLVHFLLKNKMASQLLDESYFKSGFQFDFSFKIQKLDHPIKTLLLKMAYLTAFNKLGYSLIFGPKTVINPNYKTVIDQINQPDKVLIKEIPFCVNTGLKFKEIGIVVDPPELACLFVNIPVNLGTETDYYTIFLPALDNRGFNFFDHSFNKEKIDLKFNKLPNINFWESPKESTKLYAYWKHFNEWCW